MQTSTWKIGNRIIHPVHGPAEISFVGAEYVGLRFDETCEALIRLDGVTLEPWSEAAEAAWREQQSQTETENRLNLPWPDSTFAFETGEEDTHFSGSHWDPWFEQGVNELLPRLPVLLREATLAEPASVARDALHGIPSDWTQGLHLVWPDAEHGILINIAFDPAARQNHVIGLLPFDSRGSRHTLEIDKVRVWKSGVEAQIEACAGEAPLAFFDTHFLHTRGEYEHGRKLSFTLVGMAYEASPSTVFELPFTPNPDGVAWQKQRAAERGEVWEEPPEHLILANFAMFVPIPEWDIDDYQFRGPVKSVEAFDDFLGQAGWRVRVTVMRLSDYAQEDFDLDILISRRAWTGDVPPQIGQDIEGALWLQGRMAKTEG